MYKYFGNNERGLPRHAKFIGLIAGFAFYDHLTESTILVAILPREVTKRGEVAGVSIVAVGSPRSFIDTFNYIDSRVA